MKNYYFYSACVQWPEDEVDALIAIVANSRVISRATFMRHVYIEQELLELIPSKYYGVSFHKSTVGGETFYYFDWICIEHVFRIDPSAPLPELD